MLSEAVQEFRGADPRLAMLALRWSCLLLCFFTRTGANLAILFKIVHAVYAGS